MLSTLFMGNAGIRCNVDGASGDSLWFGADQEVNP